MFWKRTQKGQTSEHVVTEFLKRFSTVKPKDRETKQYTFWQKAYPNLFTVKPEPLAGTERTVIVFRPKKDEEVDDIQGEQTIEDPNQLEGPPGGPRPARPGRAPALDTLPEDEIAGPPTPSAVTPLQTPRE